MADKGVAESIDPNTIMVIGRVDQHGFGDSVCPADGEYHRKLGAERGLCQNQHPDGSPCFGIWVGRDGDFRHDLEHIRSHEDPQA